MSKGLQLHWAISTAVASADFLAFTVGKTVLIKARKIMQTTNVKNYRALYARCHKGTPFIFIENERGLAG
jgi:hypothetical protein